MSNTIIGTFKSPADAQVAIDRMMVAGVTNDELSVMMAEGTRNTHFAIDKSTKVAEGAATGGAIGGTLGAIVAGIVAVSTIVVPGLGLVAAGSLVAALAGAGAGAATGGLIGGLVGLGFDKHQAELVEKSLRDGHIAIGVRTDDSKLAEKVEQILNDMEADSIAA